MKKWIRVMLLCLCITWSATACGKTDSSVDSQESTASSKQQEESASDETITESDLAETQPTQEIYFAACSPGKTCPARPA